ncbi:hypothetical protein SFC65_10510 [Priestia filamentosa]|uniref:hypothetical protein n=1 Tax=Priestia filamentosa TaxID=1402861 RepID=UPI0003066B90|nr:hypothetical protein [Priestia filamentosa]WCM16981.1 hypothetical protein PGN40_06440 [Priestia filamentosa]
MEIFYITPEQQLFITLPLLAVIAGFLYEVLFRNIFIGPFFSFWFPLLLYWSIPSFQYSLNWILYSIGYAFISLLSSYTTKKWLKL